MVKNKHFVNKKNVHANTEIIQFAMSYIIVTAAHEETSLFLLLLVFFFVQVMFFKNAKNKMLALCPYMQKCISSFLCKNTALKHTILVMFVNLPFATTPFPCSHLHAPWLLLLCRA